MLTYETPLAAQSSSTVCVETDLASEVCRGSTPSIAAAADAAADAAACLLVGGVGNNSATGHWARLRATPVGGVDGAGAGAGFEGFSLLASCFFFFLLLLLWLLLAAIHSCCCCCFLFF